MRVCDKANNQITYIPVKGALLMANDNQIAFLCSRLKELREKNGCTMDDMAKKIDVLEGLKPGTGMNKSSISRVEGGKTAEKTLLEMARKYCKVFGMSESQTEQFLRGEKVAVPDTSALLKNSQLIDELNKEYSKVVIPKVVVDELDNIKNKNSGSLGRKAWEVIRGISYGSRTILMEYNGDADEDNEDCKIIYIAQEASDTYHCKVDIITEDTDYSAYLKGHESVSALHLREYMATKTKIFDGDFYTGYQSFLFEKELQTASIDKSKIAEITINNEVYDIVASNNYVVLSSGIKDLWSDIANAKNLGTIFASPYISADVKYYVVKQLREHGYTIFAYGDSKIDLYMLREADKGFLYIGKRISRSLKNESLSGLVPIYDHSLVILADEDEEVKADIVICKSNSGISGSRLAAAHVRLGEKIGRHIATVFPEKNTSILVLERGGRFFGDGVYMGAGGIFYSMNPKQDDTPVINTERVVIVDSVINTGKSIMRIIDELKNHNPSIDVIIAANVIQNEAVELFKDYLVFATRLSKNSFVGVNQSKQTGKTGPDTADRLFNLIKKRY